MKRFGKRLFTRLCRRFDVRNAVRRLPGRFFWAWWEGRFSRRFREKRVFSCGVFVVKLW
jgi:hypothetical protein